jgi:hypothetical protein
MDHARLVAVAVLTGLLVVECFSGVLLALLKAWVIKGTRTARRMTMDHARLVAVCVLAGLLVVECFGDVLLAMIKAWVMK